MMKQIVNSIPWFPIDNSRIHVISPRALPQIKILVNVKHNFPENFLNNRQIHPTGC